MKKTKEQIEKELIDLVGEHAVAVSEKRTAEGKLARLEKDFREAQQAHADAIAAARAEVDSMIVTKDTAVHNEFMVREQLNKSNAEIIALRGENAGLKNQLNQLADLFNESFQMIQDAAVVSSVVARTIKTNEQIITGKMNAFNNPEPKNPQEGEPKK